MKTGAIEFTLSEKVRSARTLFQVGSSHCIEKNSNLSLKER